MKVALALAAALVVTSSGCSSDDPPSPTDGSSTEPTSWIAMAPGDALPFEGPGGELLLIYVDETYDIDGAYASALTWKLGEDYTTDYFVQQDADTLEWYGRKGEWRAGHHGEQPRELEVVDHQVSFGDHRITLSDDGAPVEVRLPDGVYTR